MHAAILAIGDELLEGRTDTNSAWIAQTLDRIGWRVVESRQCRDDIGAIVRNLEELTAVAQLVITTGGLGPTTDDLTTEAVCRWAGDTIVTHEAQWEFIQRRFKERGYDLPPSNIKQAQYPSAAQPLMNKMGSAIGYLAERGGRRVATFPGVPREMKWMLENELLPRLQAMFPRDAQRVVRKLRIFGHTESAVNALMAGIADGIDGVEISYLVSYPEVFLFFKVNRPTEDEARAVADKLAAEAKRRLGDKCYGEDEDTLAGALGELLKEAGLKLATAESCTGGLIGELVTDVAGSSAYYLEGVITYGNFAKTRQLGVKKETLAEYGAVSGETCEEMLAGLFERTGADLGVAVTGIAGPGGGTPEKPVGTVFIGWGDRDGQEVREFHFAGQRGDIRRLTAYQALDLLRRFVMRM